MNYQYAKIPSTISYKSLNDSILSCGPYRVVKFKDGVIVKKLKDLLETKLSRSHLGVEVGSSAYTNKSTHYFIRTQSLIESSFILSNEDAVPILPQSFVGNGIKSGDVIISKDGNIGEVCIADKDLPNYMLSGALYRLPLFDHLKYYVFSYIKSSIFREQLDCLVPKGATLRHAKQLFLDCDIIFPKNANGEIDENMVKYAELMTKAIINKERLIRERHRQIMQIIDNELKDNQRCSFEYKYPSFSQIRDTRIDAGQYCKEFKECESLIINYNNGYTYLDKTGLNLIPGPSLEIKKLKVRIDSDIPLPGYNRLITPTIISNYGVTTKNSYIGTPYKINPIKKYDILFGESGTGRTMVFLDDDTNVINNAHAHVLRPKECSYEKAISIRCILQYYKEIGYTDYMTVGGAGGHLSPSYFNRVPVPNFPKNIDTKLKHLYYSESVIPSGLCIDDFEISDNLFNNEAGIYELDKTSKILKERLSNLFDCIMNDNPITIKFYP